MLSRLSGTLTDSALGCVENTSSSTPSKKSNAGRLTAAYEEHRICKVGGVKNYALRISHDGSMHSGTLQYSCLSLVDTHNAKRTDVLHSRDLTDADFQGGKKPIV